MSTTTRLLSALGIIHREAATTGSPRPMIPARAERSDITHREALGIDGVYRAVSILSTGVRSLTLDAYRRRVTIDAPTLISRPDPRRGTSLADVTGMTTTSLALRGNAYWRVGRDAQGAAVAVRVLHPDLCTPSLNPETGDRTVTTPEGTFTHGTDVYHLRLLDTMTSYGLGPIQAFAGGLVTARRMAAYAAQLARPGIPTGTLRTTERISRAEADQAREEWEKKQATPGGVAVLGAGLDFKPILLTAAEVEFIESRKLDTAAVARLFGIPPHLMNVASEGTSLTYQNIRDANAAFVTWGLGPYLSVIEDAFTELLPRGVTARFNLDAFLRPSTKERYETHKIGIDAGFIFPDEVRDIEGLDRKHE